MNKWFVVYLVAMICFSLGMTAWDFVTSREVLGTLWALIALIFVGSFYTHWRHTRDR